MAAAERFQSYLRRRKMFYTREREEILRAVESLPPGFDADDVCARVRAHGLPMAQSTVYRNLRLLLQAGEIETVGDPLGGRHAFRRTAPHTRPRIVLRCRDSGAEGELDDLELTACLDRLCRRHGLDPVGLTVRIEVRCAPQPVETTASTLPAE